MFGYLFLVLIVFCIINVCVCVDSNVLLNEIIEIIENIMKCWNNFVFVIFVVKDGSVVYFCGFGFRDLDY